MSISYTLSDIAADFGSGAKHVSNSASPFLEFEFGMPPRVFKSTMVKNGGPMVAWQQPVLLTGAAASRLIVTAKSHKSMLPDTTIGHGTIDLATAAGSNAPIVVPLTGKTGKSAGNVRFVVTQGQGAGMGNISQPAPNNNGVVEGVGGPGRNIEGAALGAGLGAGAGGLAGHHHNQGNQGYVEGQPGYGAGGGHAHTGTGMVGTSASGMQGGIVPAGGPGTGAGYNNGQQGMMGGQQGMAGQQQGGMMGQQGGLGGQQGALVGQQQQGGMMGQQGGMGGGIGGTPAEVTEKHTHSLHDHDENESYETRRVG